MAGEEGDELWKTLSRIADELTSDNLRDIKNLCQELKLRTGLQAADGSHALLRLLQEHQLVTIENTSVLEKLLVEVGRQDLVNEHLGESIKWLTDWLKEKYEHCFANFKPLPWNEQFQLHLKDVYTRLVVERRGVQTTLLKTGEELKSELDIFHKLHESHEKRVIVKGSPAIGKSVFVRKLAYDWACGILQRFDLVFLIALRHVKNKSLIDVVFEQLLPCDAAISKLQLYHYIKHHSESVLFLFDGYDELNPDQEKNELEVYKVIQGTLFPSTTSVTTTRPHEHDKELSQINIWFEIKGFSEANYREYIQKYFISDSETGYRLIKEVRQLKFDFDDSFLCNPLYVSFLCVLWEDSKDSTQTAQLPRLITDLYSKIYDCILKRQRAKDAEQLESIQKAATKLASDVYNVFTSIKSEGNHLILRQKEISDEISLSLGFLVKDIETVSNAETNIHYFFHRTWQEYFIAMHISRNIERNDDVREVLRRLILFPESNSQILRFVCGIMKEKAEIALQIFASVYKDLNRSKIDADNS
ncbi:NLR family CARD domain-containing protein 4-like [Glandiceps talaboti]